MHKFAKDKLAEWLHTEKARDVVAEYPIVPGLCGTVDNGGILTVHHSIGKKVSGGWSVGKSYEESLDVIRTYTGDPTLYPVAICDVFTYSTIKHPYAIEIWEIRHTNPVTPEKKKAVLDCYLEQDEAYGSAAYGDKCCRVSPHFFEVDASVILGFDVNVKPKDALRKLRRTTPDLNPKAQLTEEQWKAQFEKEDENERLEELYKRFRESDELKQHLLEVKTLKEKQIQALSDIKMEEFLSILLTPESIKSLHEHNEKIKARESVQPVDDITTPITTIATTPRAAKPSMFMLMEFFGKLPPLIKLNMTPVEWAKEYLNMHLRHMLPDIKDVRKAWMEKT